LDIFNDYPTKLHAYTYRELDVLISTIDEWANHDTEKTDKYYKDKYPQYKELIEIHRDIYKEVAKITRPFAHEYCQKRLEEDIKKAYPDWRQI
jgi:hypothetical protein